MPADVESAPMTTGTSVLQKGLLVGFGLAVVVVVLAIGEVGMRVLGVGAEYRYEDPFVGFAAGKDLFVLDEAGDRYLTNEEKLEYFNPQSFEVEKPPNGLRIFAVGGSTTAGRPYDHEVAFCRWLELFLQESDVHRGSRCINAGGISYASYRVVVLLEELMRYEPDAIVVYTGHNEFLEERSYGNLDRGHGLVRHVDAMLSPLRVYTTARHALREIRAGEGRTVVPREVTTRLDGWTGIEQFRRDTQLEESVIEHFAFNLQQMVTMARNHGVEIFFVEPVSNIKDFSPFKSEFSAEMSAVDRGRIEASSQRVEELSKVGDWEAARIAAADVVDADPAHAGNHFQLGRILLRLDELEDARESLFRAKDLDVAPLRARQRLVELVREVATRENVGLIELSAVLEELNQTRVGHSILGNEVFLDHVHPNIEVHALIATRLVELLAEGGLVPSPDSSARESWQDLVAARMATFDRKYYAERDLNLAKVLGWAGKLAEAEAPLLRAAEVLTEHPQVHLNLGIVFEHSGRLVEAETALRRALELAPGMPEVSFNLGVTLGRQGKTSEGIERLERAIALREGYLEAVHNLGVLRREAGDLAGSVSAFEAALELDENNAEILAGLGRSLMQLGRQDEGIAVLERAATLSSSPSNESIVRVDLATALVAQGEIDRAISELTEIAEEHPGLTIANFELARVLATDGRLAEAVNAYQRALDSEPANATIANNLGILLARLGELAAARRHLESAIRIAPGFANAHFNLGIVLDQLGEPGGAAGSIGRAIELDPNNPEYHQAFGLLLYARGDREAGKAHLDIAEQGGLILPPDMRRRLGLDEEPSVSQPR